MADKILFRFSHTLSSDIGFDDRNEEGAPMRSPWFGAPVKADKKAETFALTPADARYFLEELEGRTVREEDGGHYTDREDKGFYVALRAAIKQLKKKLNDA